MKQVIVVENLIKKYKSASKNAIDNISFTINEGDFFALLGPNGAGKTTTISILTTTLSKTSGKITIAGFDLDTHPSEVRQNIGVIFQNPSLDKNLTAEENIRFHAVLYGLYTFSPSFTLMPQEYKKRVTDLAEILDLKNDIFKPIKTFSGGMKRKLEIIRSLMHHPKILFLDEPTSGLDPISRKNLWEYLKEVRKKEHTTIFLTTHYLEEAEDADIVCVVNHGKIINSGTPETIKKHLIKEYILLETNEKEKLEKELQKMNLTFTQEKGFKVEIENKQIQKLISGIKVPLTSIKTHSPSLEDAYVELIGADHLE